MSTIAATIESQKAIVESSLLVQLAGTYMTFRVANETYALSILSVREIVQPLPLSRVPDASDYIMGLINLRGRVIAVMDLRARIGLSPAEKCTVARKCESTAVIILELEHAGEILSFGLHVDEVEEVIHVEPGSIEAVPRLALRAGVSDFLVGVTRISDRVYFLIAPDLLMDSSKLVEVQNPQNAGGEDEL